MPSNNVSAGTVTPLRGMEVISMAAVLKPDGIIMDINMPKIDGKRPSKLKPHSP
jgi:CheY-like chemotaxis protein